MPLRFEPYQSYFVLFRQSPAHEQARERRRQELQRDRRSSARWPDPGKSPSMPRGHGDRCRTAGRVHSPSWRIGPDARSRRYDTTRASPLTVPSSMFPRRSIPRAITILLELGEVHCLARVRLNGQDLGTLWCAPWSVDVTRALQAKGNRLEIEVANSVAQPIDRGCGLCRRAARGVDDVESLSERLSLAPLRPARSRTANTLRTPCGTRITIRRSTESLREGDRSLRGEDEDF